MVQIGKRTVRDGNHLYATMNLDALQQAMCELKGSSLKMWLYLNKNQEKYTFELSRQACLDWGIRKDSYYDGLKELQEKGYLIQARSGSNFYTFYESPQAEKQNSEKSNNYFTEDPKLYSGNQNHGYGNPNGWSGNQYRNNIYNTDILHNKTCFGLSEKEEAEYRRLGF